MMKVLYIGSKQMGFDGLNILSDFQRSGAIEIVAVVARSDDDKKQWYPSVSKRVRELNLPTHMPASVKDESFLRSIDALKPDIGFCCFYPNLFPESLFRLPKHGIYNMHFAPLPRYRGALPIPYAIINGEHTHGVTIHRIAKGMDSGEIASQVILPLFHDDTGYDLYKRCERFGALLFRETVAQFVNAGGVLPMRKQKSADVISHVRQDMKSLEMQLSWGWEKIHRFVRAFDFPPFDLPFIKMDGKVFRMTVKPERHGLDPNALPFREFRSHKIFLVEKKNVDTAG